MSLDPYGSIFHKIYFIYSTLRYLLCFNLNVNVNILMVNVSFMNKIFSIRSKFKVVIYGKIIILKTNKNNNLNTPQHEFVLKLFRN